MFNSTWNHIERLHYINDRLDRIKRTRRTKRLCEAGICLVGILFLVAVVLITMRHLEQKMQPIAESAQQQLVLDDGKQVLVIPTEGHGEPFLFPSLKKPPK